MTNLFRLITVAIAIASCAAGADTLPQTNINSAPTNRWGGGVFFGRPIKGSLKGLIKTYEMGVSVGYIPGSQIYIGQSLSVSTKDPNVFQQWQKLDSTKDYVFHYESPHPMNPIWEDTHMLITSISEIKTNTPLDAVPSEMGPIGGKHGNYSRGTRKGVITNVERWGFFDTVCSFTLNLGGHGLDKENEDMTVMNIYNEDGCKMAENLVNDPREVQIDYSQAYIVIWDAHDHFVHSIKVLSGNLINYSSTNAIAANEKGVSTLTPTQAEVAQIKQQLLNDPQFINEIKTRIAEQEHLQH